MINTILVIIILLISINLILRPVGNIFILLCAIIIFIFGSLILFSFGHLLIGAVFILVYTGAILVFICISLLISPNIEKNKNLKSEIKFLFNFNFLNFFIFLLILIFFFYNFFSFINPILYEYNLTFKDIDFSLNNFKVKEDIENALVYLDKIDFYNKFVMNISELVSDTIFFIGLNINCFYVDFNFYNEFIAIYKNNINIIIFIGFYLLASIVGCLIIFTINHLQKLIKRQDSVNQIIKKYL